MPFSANLMCIPYFKIVTPWIALLVSIHHYRQWPPNTIDKRKGISAMMGSPKHRWFTSSSWHHYIRDSPHSARWHVTCISERSAPRTAQQAVLLTTHFLFSKNKKCCLTEEPVSIPSERKHLFRTSQIFEQQRGTFQIRRITEHLR
jgi:hypothetical protein